MSAPDLPAPLVPADANLRDFDYMPLHVRRLRDSRFKVLTTGDEFRAGVLLWAAAWHQLPAGSLPDDDIELADLAGFGHFIKNWKKVRPKALHGWIRCSDDRLYHKVVAEVVNNSWRARLVNQHERAQDRIRKENKKRRENKVAELKIPDFDDWNSERIRSLSGGISTEIRPNSETIPPPFQKPAGGIPAENALNGSRSEVLSNTYGGNPTIPPAVDKSAQKLKTSGTNVPENQDPAPWWKSNPGIDAKARELGLKAGAHETYPQLKARIFDHLNGEKRAHA